MTVAFVACAVLFVGLAVAVSCFVAAWRRGEFTDDGYEKLREPGMGRVMLTLTADTTKFTAAMRRARSSTAALYAELAPYPRLVVGDRVKTAAEKQQWTVRGVTARGRFVILTKPFNLRHTVLYSVIDFQRGVRGRDNYYGLGYETDDDIAYALRCFQYTEDGDPPSDDVLDAGVHAAEVSHRHSNHIRLDLQEINGEPCEWDGSAP